MIRRVPRGALTLLKQARTGSRGRCVMTRTRFAFTQFFAEHKAYLSYAPTARHQTRQTAQMSRLLAGEIARLQGLRGMDEDRSQTDRVTQVHHRGSSPDPPPRDGRRISLSWPRTGVHPEHARAVTIVMRCGFWLNLTCAAVVTAVVWVLPPSP